MMIKCDAPQILTSWLDGHQQTFRDNGVNAILRPLSKGDAESNEKWDSGASSRFTTLTHCAEITLWRTGMLDFDIWDMAAKELVAHVTAELFSLKDIRSELDSSLAQFLRAISRPDIYAKGVGQWRNSLTYRTHDRGDVTFHGRGLTQDTAAHEANLIADQEIPAPVIGARVQTRTELVWEP